MTRLQLKTVADMGDGNIMNSDRMQVSEVLAMRDQARSDVEYWLAELDSRLDRGNEIAVCEATRMLVFYVRHFWIANTVLARRQKDGSDAWESLEKVDQAIGLLDRALGAVTDPPRKQRIDKRLDLLNELRLLQQQEHPASLQR